MCSPLRTCVCMHVSAQKLCVYGRRSSEGSIIKRHSPAHGLQNKATAPASLAPMAATATSTAAAAASAERGLNGAH